MPSELVKALSHPVSHEVFSGYSRFDWAEKSAAILSLFGDELGGPR